MERYVAVDNVCAWPNLTLMPDGAIVAAIFNRPSHGQEEGEEGTVVKPPDAVPDDQQGGEQGEVDHGLQPWGGSRRQYRGCGGDVDKDRDHGPPRACRDRPAESMSTPQEEEHGEEEEKGRVPAGEGKGDDRRGVGKYEREDQSGQGEIIGKVARILSHAGVGEIRKEEGDENHPEDEAS